MRLDLNYTLSVLQDKLLCIILGMLRRQSFSFVDSYWKETFATIKATIKQTVIEIVAESDSPMLCSNSDHTADAFTLDEQLKLLTIEEWVHLLRNTANALKILLERIEVNDMSSGYKNSIRL